MPPQPNLAAIRYSPDGTKLAFTQATDSGTELWIADVATGQARAATVGEAERDVRRSVRMAVGQPRARLPRHRLDARSPCRRRAAVPTGPNVQENEGKPAPVRTYEDLLANAHDEALFDYYFTSQIAIVDAASGLRTPIGKPAIYDEVSASPDGRFLLVERIHRPYSRLVPAGDFPHAIEVLDRRGQIVKTIGDLPLADAVPNNGVRTGPRAVAWDPAEPATLAWAEALDGGNAADEGRAPRPRPDLGGAVRGGGGGAREDGVPLPAARVDRQGRRPAARVRPRPPVDPHLDPREGRGAETVGPQRRGPVPDPGTPLDRPAGREVRAFGDIEAPTVLQIGDAIFATGSGASPQGDRPFLDRVDLKTLATDRLFRSDDRSYETVEGVLDGNGTSVLTRHETPTDPPNYFVRTLAAAGGNAPARQLTGFSDPTPQVRAIHKQLITYPRADGVELSGTLYLPPDYKPGERLPLVMWAYPREFTDPKAASQVVGSPNRFTTIRRAHAPVLAVRGLRRARRPDDADRRPRRDGERHLRRAARRQRAGGDRRRREMGVADPNRVGVGGHSYGAFMTANLLAHSRLFRAGFAGAARTTGP